MRVHTRAHTREIIVSFFFHLELVHKLPQISRQNPDYVVEARETIPFFWCTLKSRRDLQIVVIHKLRHHPINLAFTVVSFLNELFKSMF